MRVVSVTSLMNFVCLSAHNIGIMSCNWNTA